MVVGGEQGRLAEASGIQPGDVIKEVNRKRIANLAGYNAAVTGSVLLLMKRGKQTFFVTMQTRR